MDALTHAGGIVARLTDGVRLLLLVRSKDGAHWVLPKGHLEAGEAPEDAAAREVQEESGVEARVVEPVGTISFDRADERVICRYYLMRWVAEGIASEPREKAWLTLAGALQRVTFPNTADLLRKADAMAAAWPHGDGGGP